MISLLREPAGPRQIARMLEDWKVLVKVVVDGRREVAAGGGEIHVDGVALLLREGSRREDLWGATWYPETLEAHLEALVNVRPRHGNPWVRIDDRDTRSRVESLVRRFFEIGAEAVPRPLAGGSRDRKAAREGFLREPISARLGGIAAVLERAASLAPHAGHADSASELLDEARHLIEWTGLDLDPALAGELVDLQLGLTLWIDAWGAGRAETAARTLLSHEAGRWADRVFALSEQAAEAPARVVRRDVGRLEPGYVPGVEGRRPDANPRTGGLGKRG